MLNLGEDEIKFCRIWIPVQIYLVKCTTSALWTDSSVFLYSITHWISTTQDNKVIYIITNVSMVDVENRRKAILVLKSRVPPFVQMFALAQDWFMVFPALVPLVIFTAEHVYSGNPGDRFSTQGVISHNKRVIKIDTKRCGCIWSMVCIANNIH